MQMSRKDDILARPVTDHDMMHRSNSKRDRVMCARMPLWSSSWSLVGLSMLWLSLCTGLVMKHPRLIEVFYAILCCVALAGSLIGINIFFSTRYLGNKKRGGVTRREIKTNIDTRVLFLFKQYLEGLMPPPQGVRYPVVSTERATQFGPVPVPHVRKISQRPAKDGCTQILSLFDMYGKQAAPLVKNFREREPRLAGSNAVVHHEVLLRNARVRNQVGLIACCVSFSFVSVQTNMNWIHQWLGRSVSIAQYDDVDDGFRALSMAAGYLAFDHWFVPLYCAPVTMKSLVAVMEDAATLIFFLIVLVWAVDQEEKQQQVQVLMVYRNWIRFWLVYEVLRLIVQYRHLGAKLDYSGLTSRQIMDPKQANLVPDQSIAKQPSGPAESKKSSLLLARSNVDKIHHDPSMLWSIRGLMYDLNDYVAFHPGGHEAILLGRGRDCTALFQSYHPFTIQHERVLQQYCIQPSSQNKMVSTCNVSSQSRWVDHVLNKTKPLPSNNTQYALSMSADETLALDFDFDQISGDDPFYSILCQRVARVLHEHNLHPKRDRVASWSRQVYYAIVIVAVVLTGRAHGQGSIVGSTTFAIFGWLLGAMGHDAGHFAASRWPWVNHAGVWAMSLLCNPIMWQHQHTYAHHSHTNDITRDPDLHHFYTLLRVHQRFRQHDLYKHQRNWWYVAAAYTLVVFGTCVWIPIGMIRDGSLYGLVEWTDRQRPWRALGLYAHLMAYVSFVLLWPFWVHAHWLNALIAVLMHVATSGIIFAMFSQINHLNEASLDLRLQEERNVHRRRHPALATSWAVSQVETSNNFCPNSTFWYILSNGLNLQIEHHLFPGLNHCHLSRIQPVVERTCREFGVSYRSYQSWNDLMQATLAWLDRLAVEPDTISFRAGSSRASEIA